MKKYGFTLAEVLITLMIIGIVAALTIPSVISNYQQQEFKTGLKKAVSVLNEAIQTNIAQDGETPYDNEDLFSYIQKHMSVIKSGRTNWIIQEWSNDRSWGSAGANLTFYTTDGMRFEVSPVGHREQKLHESDVIISRHDKFRGGNWGKIVGNCGSYGLANNPNQTIEPPCLITVDVNGDKKPNPQAEFVGNFDAGTGYSYPYPSPSDKKLTDIFNIMITDEKAIPFGVVAQRAMYSSK